MPRTVDHQRSLVGTSRTTSCTWENPVTGEVTGGSSHPRHTPPGPKVLLHGVGHDDRRHRAERDGETGTRRATAPESVGHEGITNVAIPARMPASTAIEQEAVADEPAGRDRATGAAAGESVGRLAEEEGEERRPRSRGEHGPVGRLGVTELPAGGQEGDREGGHLDDGLGRAQHTERPAGDEAVETGDPAPEVGPGRRGGPARHRGRRPGSCPCRCRWPGPVGRRGPVGNGPR